MFSKNYEIDNQIEEYALWKYERTPHMAGAQQSLLLRFSRDMRITRVGDITFDMVAYFTGAEGTEYRRQECLKALRSFLRYCKWAGYECIPYNHVTEFHMEKKKGRPLESDRAKEAIKMRKLGVPYRTISRELTEKFEKPTYVGSIFRWVNPKVIPTK